jgi:hypothetical protein
MAADNVMTAIRRYSSMVDTSGAEAPRGFNVAVITGGGVYTQAADNATDITNGRISLGIVAAFVVGAVAFYIWTNNIQGGG